MFQKTHHYGLMDLLPRFLRSLVYIFSWYSTGTRTKTRISAQSSSKDGYIYFISNCIFSLNIYILTTLELQNPDHDGTELNNIYRSPDLKSLKLWKVYSRSGEYYPRSDLSQLLSLKNRLSPFLNYKQLVFRLILKLFDVKMFGQVHYSRRCYKYVGLDRSHHLLPRSKPWMYFPVNIDTFQYRKAKSKQLPVWPERMYSLS